MILTSRIATALATGMLTIFAVGAGAQTETTTSTTTTTHKMSRTGSDTTFVSKAAQGGLAEVELGNLASQKASSPEVKQFGERMVTDHTKANDQLKQIASKDNLAIPTTLSAKDQALKNRLNKLSGSSFDKAYMEAMVKDHKTDVAEFQHEAKNGTNPDVKEFAASTVPTLQDHLKQAESTLSQVKGSSKGMASRQQ